MACPKNTHKIGVGYDCEFECERCGTTFVADRFYPNLHITMVQENLKHCFGEGEWHLEWLKLRSTKRTMKTLRLTKLPKGSEIKLTHDKVYFYEDFLSPMTLREDENDI